MSKAETKKILMGRFKELYPKGSIPLAFQLDGFTHNVYFLDVDGKVKMEDTTNCMSEGERSLYSSMTSRCHQLFEGFANYAYQNNAQEIVIHDPEEIEGLKRSIKLSPSA